MIKVRYNKVCARCVQSEPLTSGMVGQTVHFDYSHDFDGLTVTAVFTNGKKTVDVLNPGAECVIPHEVLDTAGAAVKVGVYAYKGSDLVIPTVYAPIGVVLPGADPSGDVEADPTLPIWAQLQAMIGALVNLSTTDKASLVAAINELHDSIPTKTSQLENDSGFIDDSDTEETSVLALSKVATTGRYADLLGLPTIPTVPSKVSGFTNDAGYLTLATLPKYEGAVE